MRLEYRLRYLDNLLFTLFHQFFNAPLQAFYLLLTVFIGWSWSETESIPFGLAAGLLAYIIMWIGQILLTAVYLISRRSDGTLTDHVIELREDACYESTRFNESRFFWPGILRVVRRPGFVAVYVSQHLAHVIPMRAFVSRQQASEFISYVKQRIVAV